MTPQERQLVADLFDRLASLEGERRDPEAEKAIRDGLTRAPNALYALVQTVLVQDEALRRANDRLQELEGAAPREGFLDSVRNAVFGHEQRQGSVPSVRPGGHSVWGDRYAQGDRTQGGPMGAPPMPPAGYGAGPQGSAFGGGSGGGSFLGTAAATAAGVIGGALLLNSIRGMFGPQPGGHAAFDPGSAGGGSPWESGGSGGNLAREAGLDDIGSGRSGSYDNARSAGLLGGYDGGSSDYDDGGDFGGDFGGDGDSA